MFWGSFSDSAVGYLVPIEGMMNSDKYNDVIEKKVVPDMKRAFPDGGGIFQHDLTPCHSSKKVKTVFRKHKLSVLEWPGTSSDLNPIENLWAITKFSLQKVDCTTVTKLIEGIIQVWFRDPQIKEKQPKIGRIYAKASDASVKKQRWPYQLLKLKFCEV